jgi:hypothetical protein
MTEASDPARTPATRETRPVPEPVAPRGPSPTPSRHVKLGKIYGPVAFVLAAALGVMWFYYEGYRSTQVRQELWQASQTLGRPVYWEGGQSVPHEAPIVVGEFLTTFPPAAGADPVESLWAWLGRLEHISGINDVETFRRQCFGGAACDMDFSYGKYRGSLIVYPARATPPAQVGVRYEMWLPH